MTAQTPDPSRDGPPGGLADLLAPLLRRLGWSPAVIALVLAAVSLIEGALRRGR